MECEDWLQNGRVRAASGSRVSLRAVKPQLGGSASALRLGFPPAVHGQPARRKMLLSVGAPHETDAIHTLRIFNPFMNNMDEITYWIYTKRAPCLFNYDNVIKNQHEEAHCSKRKPRSVPSEQEVPSPKKRTKKKLSLLDDDSVSERQQNIYFDTSQKQKKTVISNSDTLGSDINFNIKKSSVQQKPKRRVQKNNTTILHKKNTVITSTPKASTLRRSLRQAQQTNNNISQLDSSCEIFNTGLVNGNGLKSIAIEKKVNKSKKLSEVLAGGDQTIDSKKPVTNTRHEALNGQFEDLSDVSGFTANYIRSTKLQSTKTPRKLRCKNNRNLVKESQPSQAKEDNTVACVNKSVNTKCPSKSAILNCSTDSSQNIINVVTSKNNDKSVKVSKSTSILKFMDTKTNKSGKGVANKPQRSRSKPDLNISFQSRTSSTPRYPTRYKSSMAINTTQISSDNVMQTPDRRRKAKNPSECNNSDRKENPSATVMSKTRSGRSIGLTIRQPENSVLVLSNSTEQVSSDASMDVATPQREKLRKKRRITKPVRTKKLMNSDHAQKDSMREKSGFSACFSDSDSEPLRPRKYFCA